MLSEKCVEGSLYIKIHIILHKIYKDIYFYLNIKIIFHFLNK